MDEISQEPSARRRGGRSSPARRVGGILVVGIAIGLAAGLFLPDVLGPRLPGFLGGGSERVEGEVLSKERSDDHLLLTVDTDRGALLTTFRERISELDLLVAEGDSIALRLRAFEPFVEDPAVLSVRKFPADEGRAGSARGASGAPASGTPAPSGEGTPEPDTAGAGGG